MTIRLLVSEAVSFTSIGSSVMSRSCVAPLYGVSVNGRELDKAYLTGPLVMSGRGFTLLQEWFLGAASEAL